MKWINLPDSGGYPFQAEFYASAVRNYIRKLKNRIGVLHVHSPLVSGIRSDAPTVTTIHTPIVADVARYEWAGSNAWLSRFQGPFSWLAEDSLLRSSQALTAVSDSAARETKATHPWISRPIVIGNAVDPSTFSPRTTPYSGRPVVLYKGRLAPRKRPFEFVKTAELLIEEGIDADFQVSGDGPLRSAIERYIARRNLRTRVTVTGMTTRSQVPSTYAAAAVYVAPARYEGLPTGVLEAMSCGLPVVAARNRSHAELITDGVEGKLVPQDNRHMMAAAIRLYVEDAQLARRCGEAGRAKVLARYTWESVGARVLSVYHAIKRVAE